MPHTGRLANENKKDRCIYPYPTINTPVIFITRPGMVCTGSRYFLTVSAFAFNYLTERVIFAYRSTYRFMLSMKFVKLPFSAIDFTSWSY